MSHSGLDAPEDLDIQSPRDGVWVCVELVHRPQVAPGPRGRVVLSHPAYVILAPARPPCQAVDLTASDSTFVHLPVCP